MDSSFTCALVNGGFLKIAHFEKLQDFGPFWVGATLGKCTIFWQEITAGDPKNLANWSFLFQAVLVIYHQCHLQPLCLFSSSQACISAIVFELGGEEVCQGELRYSDCWSKKNCCKTQECLLMMHKKRRGP